MNTCQEFVEDNVAVNDEAGNPAGSVTIGAMCGNTLNSDAEKMRGVCDSCWARLQAEARGYKHG